MYFAYHSATQNAIPYPYDIGGEDQTPSPEFILLWALETVINLDIEFIDINVKHLNENFEEIGYTEEQKEAAIEYESAGKTGLEEHLALVKGRMAELVAEAKAAEREIHSEL